MKAAPRLDGLARGGLACRTVLPLPRPVEVPTRRFASAVRLSLLVAVLAACGSWKRAGQPEPAAVPAERLPQIFDATANYRAMGLLTDNGVLGIIGATRLLAGPRPDSMYLILGLSLRNHGFTFRRDGDQFLADYHVETTVRGPGGVIAARSSHDERVRVASFRETQRSDESIIFQEFLTIVPGAYDLAVDVRDRNGPNAGHVEASMTVPALQTTAVSLPVAVYQASPRRTLDRPPDLVLNPRQGIEYGADSLRFYLETYDMPVGSQVVLSAVDASGRVAWRDSVRVDALAPVRGHVVAIPPGPLTIGRYDLRLEQGGNVSAATPFLVSFSDRFAAANLEDIVSLLRFFAPADTLRALLRAAPEERAAAWQRFWHSSDPNPSTPENEAIDEYLRRVQAANERFRDEGTPGWLTERGEVFIVLGEPNEVQDRRPDTSGRGRFIQWNYYEYRLDLIFIDDAGFGRFRLDNRSRSEFQRVANRVRGW